jgi:radical SAM superfamily enzyme with C-terminal helix-hairpin-helix motif
MQHLQANQNEPSEKEKLSKQISDYKRSIRDTIDPRTGKRVRLMTKKQFIKDIDSDIEELK